MNEDCDTVSGANLTVQHTSHLKQIGIRCAGGARQHEAFDKALKTTGSNKTTRSK